MYLYKVSLLIVKPIDFKYAIQVDREENSNLLPEAFWADNKVEGSTNLLPSRTWSSTETLLR